MKRNKLALLFFVLALSVLIVATALSQEKQLGAKTEQEDSPTPVQVGVMTEKQRKHSKRFGTGGGSRTLVEEPDGVILSTEDHSYPVVPEMESTPTQAQYFQALTCNADSIVIAKVENKASQLTESLYFIFTDYELNIERVFKNNSTLDLQPSKIITLTLPGGKIKVNNQTKQVIIGSQHPIRVGSKYLLFLDYLSDSESFDLSHDRGIFDISGDKIKTPENQYTETSDEISDIKNSIRRAAKNCPVIKAN